MIVKYCGIIEIPKSFKLPGLGLFNFLIFGFFTCEMRYIIFPEDYNN